MSLSLPSTLLIFENLSRVVLVESTSSSTVSSPLASLLTTAPFSARRFSQYSHAD